MRQSRLGIWFREKKPGKGKRKEGERRRPVSQGPECAFPLAIGKRGRKTRRQKLQFPPENANDFVRT